MDHLNANGNFRGGPHLDQLRALTRGKTGIIDVPCPLCGPHCKSPVNRHRKVLRIWDDGEFLTYKCARCEASGWAKDDRASSSAAVSKPAPAEPAKDKSDLARFLWGRSLPAAHTIVESYLRSRSCWIISPNIRYLPGRGGHPPAMLARFGSGPITGIHLTKLLPDGTGKAGTGADKLTIGPSTGQPVIVNDNPDRGELIVAEGIEDAASLAIVTGWTAWAAGTAGRIAPVVASAQGFEKIYLAVDDDPPDLRRSKGHLPGRRPKAGAAIAAWDRGAHKGAGARALAQARTIQPAVIAVNTGGVLGRGMDANKALQKHGPEILLAVIEWCESLAGLRSGRIGFCAWERASARSAEIFRALAGDGLG